MGPPGTVLGNVVCRFAQVLPSQKECLLSGYVLSFLFSAIPKKEGISWVFLMQLEISESWRKSLAQGKAGRSLPGSHSGSKQNQWNQLCECVGLYKGFIFKALFKSTSECWRRGFPELVSPLNSILFDLYYLQSQRQFQRRVSTFYLFVFFGMSNDNNFHVENWLHVSGLGHNILRNLQCNISAQFCERRKLWSYLNFYSSKLTASLGCCMNTKRGGNCSWACLKGCWRLLRKIICSYSWY